MYERVGSYGGKVDLGELALRLDSFEIAWAPDGHGTTTDHLLAVRDAFRDDVAQIEGEWAFSMLVILKSDGGAVPMHSDVRLLPDLVRYHLVLQTNDRCWNFHDGDWQHLERGGIYTVDETREHASINWGPTPRIHLVVDAVPAKVLEGVR